MEDNKHVSIAQNSGAYAWLFQRITGAFLVVLLAVHIWGVHYSGIFLTTKSVMERIASSWVRFVDLAILLMGLYHGFNGLMIVVFDYVESEKFQKLCFWLFLIVGTALLIFGAKTLLFLPQNLMN